MNFQGNCMLLNCLTELSKDVLTPCVVGIAVVTFKGFLRISLDSKNMYFFYFLVVFYHLHFYLSEFS